MILSISRIKAFKACRQLYRLKYIEGLEPVQKPEALETGSTYHAYLEELNKGELLAGNVKYAEEYSKEYAMALAYQKYIYPKFKCVEVEKWLELDLGDGNKLVGIVDAIADDGHIVEHKSTSMEITEAYEYNLLWDEQILAYMLMTGKRKVWYTVCRKPTIRQKKDESDEDFFYRMLDWYDEDTDSKIRLLEIERTDEEVEQFLSELLAMCYEMQSAEISEKNRVISASPFYRNTCHCNSWGRRCEYSSICLNYDPSQEYIEFVKGERYGTQKN